MENTTATAEQPKVEYYFNIQSRRFKPFTPTGYEFERTHKNIDGIIAGLPQVKRVQIRHLTVEHGWIAADVVVHHKGFLASLKGEDLYVPPLDENLQKDWERIIAWHCRLKTYVLISRNWVHINIDVNLQD